MARKRGKSWQGSLKTRSAYWRYSFPTKALAEAWEAKALSAHINSLPIPSPADGDHVPATLASFFENHRDVIWPGVVERNIESNQRAVEALLGANTLLSHIDDAAVQAMADEMVRGDLAPRTVNIRLSHLKKLLSHAKRLGYTDRDVSFPWQRVGDNARLRFLTEEEERLLLGYFRARDKYALCGLLKVLIDTGVRPSEIISSDRAAKPITWNEVSRIAGGTAPDLVDPRTGTPRSVILVARTKTGKPRTVPLTSAAEEAFRWSRVEERRRPFEGFTVTGVSKAVRAAANDLGLEDVVLYTLRHTCASRLVQRGADLYRVMKWMGHANIATTQRYAKLVPSDLFTLGELL